MQLFRVWRLEISGFKGLDWALVVVKTVRDLRDLNVKRSVHP